MNELKRILVRMMRPDGHRHLSMTDATLCKKCEPKVRAAKELYDKVVRKEPEILVRKKPEFKPSEELKEMWDNLQDRVKNDTLYKKHLERSFKGTVQEQNEEADKVNSGFYEKNTDWKKTSIISPIQMNKQEQDIAELNTIVKAIIAPSKISGVGVMAIRDIMKGEKIYADRMSKLYHIPYGSFGKLFPDVREIITERWPHVVSGEAFIYPDARLLSFMNHSSDPEKINYDPVTDCALMDIPAGAEILEDYRIVPNWKEIYHWIDTVDMV